MYCYHCGYKLDEHKLEAKKSSLDIVQDTEIDSVTQIQYVCPRCGHMIHADMSYEDSKELSRASHAQIQRGNNNFALGMSFNSVGFIGLVISIIFYFLSIKPSKGYLVTDCAEFYVFVVLLVLAIILLSSGIYFTIVGIVKKMHYDALLKDLNNKTFVQ